MTEVAAPASESRLEIPETSSLMDKTTAIVLSDGRQVVGVFAGLDSDGNVLLLRAVVKKPFKSEVDGEERVITRSSMTFMVPFKHITEFYQGDFTYEPPTQNTN
jgi:small nuclear ribonucleoprotein (snRNP)-like protein